MPWTVTRQIQWPDGTPMVEISDGDLDYTNPDALGAQYPGEFQTYDDPEEAVEAALQILDYWQGAGQTDAQLGIGATGGMTMPFEPISPEQAREWAAKRREGLPKCDRCGEILGKERYSHPEIPDQVFCREYCAESAYEDQELQELKFSSVCDSCRNVAYDNGISGVAHQAEAMAMLGADLEDHLCDAREAPGLNINCECACNPVKKIRR